MQNSRKNMMIRPNMRSGLLGNSKILQKNVFETAFRIRMLPLM